VGWGERVGALGSRGRNVCGLIEDLTSYTGFKIRKLTGYRGFLETSLSRSPSRI